MSFEQTIVEELVARLLPRLQDTIRAAVEKEIAAASKPAAKELQLYRIADVLARFGWSRNRFWQVRQGLVAGLPPFPAPIKIGAKDSWTVEDVDEFQRQLERKAS